MDRSSLDDFVASAALLAGHLTRQCEKAVSDQASAAAELRQVAEGASRSLTAGKAELADAARAAIGEALAREIPAVVEAIARTGDRLGQVTDRLQREQASAGARMRIISWQSLATLCAASALVVAGTAYLAWVNVERAERADVSAQVLEALQDVSITSCDGQPCMRLEDGQQRWARNEDYVLIHTKSAATE
ncbi:hypothetical protein [Coralloluteibacterium stylophorae]|uniref:Relaxation protein n=1 Tax=Coralloluteibacterium stylophorae TaxID=1776034 RepID=A0AAP2CDY0_9GAMM|nr:hypothetical protein [Coralloluteibacterium stylophorae]MBS7458569.1 hypothetical protein [Coralloluteibacterium stylophorae]